MKTVSITCKFGGRLLLCVRQGFVYMYADEGEGEGCEQASMEMDQQQAADLISALTAAIQAIATVAATKTEAKK